MPRYEYKLVPAPEKAARQKGLKGAARFAATLEALMNELGAEGWRYLRADTLPQSERAGLVTRVTTPRTMLVFQRELPDPAPAEAAETAAAARPGPPVARRRPARPAPPLTRPRDDTPAAEEEGDDPPSLANLFADPDTRVDPEEPSR